MKDLLPFKIYEIIERVGLCTPKQILIMSSWQIKKLTCFNSEDIALLKKIAAKCCFPQSVTSDILIGNDSKISTGCSVIDNLLCGGLRKGTITELYGESGSGKTQIALQASINNWITGTVYICTEDVFPLKRFNQMKTGLQGYCSEIDYGKNIFVEHVTESYELLNCIKIRLPKLLCNKHISLIVIDSVAATFRTDNTNYIHRAEELRELAIYLISVAREYNVALLCINQVTSSFEGGEKVLPSLGLAWSNMISTRLWLRKTRFIDKNSKQINEEIIVNTDASIQLIQIRELCVIFAAEIPDLKAELVVTSKGLLGL